MEKVSDSDLTKLLNILESELPRSVMMYNVIKLQLSLINNRKHNAINIRVFSFKDESKTNDTFLAAIITVKGLPQNLVVIFGPNEPSTEMHLALEKLIDWSKMNQFEGVETKTANFLTNVIKKYGTVETHDPIELHFMDNSFALSHLNEQINKEFMLRKLSPQNATKINSRWPAAAPGTLEMLTASIEDVGSAGIYVPSESEITNESDLINGNEKYLLASWAVALPFGSIHALYTEDKFKRQGFAGDVMKFVSKVVAEAGRIPVVQIYKSNDTSKSVNARVGFKYSHDINLLHFFPKGL